LLFYSWLPCCREAVEGRELELPQVFCKWKYIEVERIWLLA
jgi:hypothetical protein